MKDPYYYFWAFYSSFFENCLRRRIESELLTRPALVPLSLLRPLVSFLSISGIYRIESLLFTYGDEGAEEQLFLSYN